MAWSTLPEQERGGTGGDADRQSGLRTRVRRLLAGFVVSIELVGFLSAILLPFVYLPLLFLEGPDPARTLVFGGLVALHTLAVVVGARHDAGSRRQE